MGELNIIFDGGHQHYYLPGQSLSGKVAYTMNSQKKISQVVVALNGESYSLVTCGGGDHHIERIVLFHITQTLFRGPYTVQPQTLELPFSLTIPETTQYVRYDSEKDSTEFLSERHLLPPTFSTSMHHGQAWIRYKLIVQVNPDNHSKKKRVELELRIVQPSQTLPQSMPLQTCRFREVLWGSRTLRETQHTFKQKLAHVFTSDTSLATPVIRFDATVSMPSSGSPYTPLPISMSVKHELKGANDPSNPLLVLYSLEIKLEALSFIRAKCGTIDYEKHAVNVVGVKEFAMPGSELHDQKLSSKAGASGVKLPLDGQLVSLPVNFSLSSLQSSGIIIPDFKSYTACLSHELKVTAYIRHAESGHLFILKGSPMQFEVLPWVAQGTTNGARPMIAAHAASSGTSEKPPAYHTLALSPAPQYQK